MRIGPPRRLRSMPRVAESKIARAAAEALKARQARCDQIWLWLLPLPGIQDFNTHRLEIPHVACDDRHAVDHGGCGNQRIPHGSWVRYVQLGAALRHGYI